MTRMTPPFRKQTRDLGSTDGFIHTRHRNQAELTEDYVELIDELITDRGEARAVDIAKRLGVSHVTVSKAVSRLKEAGLVHSQPYRSVFLTDRGKAMARQTRERHHLVMEFLLALGVPPQTASIDAEGIEHHVSEATLKAMQVFVSKKK